MIEFYGDGAREKAREWGFEGDIEEVTYVRKSNNLGCRWVWTCDIGKCLTCGDTDFEFVEEN